MKQLIVFTSLCVAVVLSQSSNTCNQTCEPKMRHVCGTDKKTYLNKCELQKASCRQEKKTGINVEVEYNGRCCKWNCDKRLKSDFVCGSDGMTYMHMCHFRYAACLKGKMGKRIFVADMGTCKPLCMKVCPLAYKPVCGTNGLTYINECHLQKDQCILSNLGYELGVKHPGACFMKCRMDTKCPSEYEPVCGSDGQTYANECELKVTACHNKMMLKKEKLEVAFEGECDNSCVAQCSPVFKPVCGSNGKTYANKCLLRTANCLMKVNGARSRVSVSSEGACKDACVEFCPHVTYEVCGSDDKTYSSPCHLAQRACMLKKSGVTKPLTLKNKGYCKNSCERVCPPKRTLVCGTDWKTYRSMCQLKEAACKKYKAMKSKWENLEKEDMQDKMKNFTMEGWTPIKPAFIGGCRATGYSLSDLVAKCAREKSYQPICGSNGQTYLNKCHIMIENLMTNKMAGYGIMPKYLGICRKYD